MNHVNFIFNAHLPFVRHPEYPKFLEEDWLYEAINESYLPLLRMMFKLKEERIKFSLTFSISPTLCSMLQDSLLMERFESYLNSRLELGNKEIDRLSSDDEARKLAENYVANLNANVDFYTNICNRNILSAFNLLENEGFLEIITTTATHSYLPLYKDFPVAVNSQIEIGALMHSRVFDKQSEGFWLPECGYYPGLEELLVRHNIKWTSLSSQSLFQSNEKVIRGNYAPVKCPNGLYCFARDYNLTSLIWSSSEGYPADPDYREFYRDIGYDLDIEYIRPYIHEPDVRVFTGFKYWAITGKTAEKVLYNPEKADNKAKLHAKHFIKQIINTGKKLQNKIDRDPIYTLSFDAELFGHWWYEGVSWLEYVIREINDSQSICLITPTDYLDKYPDAQTLTPAFSSWGEGGYSQVWLDNSTNAWIAVHTIRSVQRMTELACRFPNQSSLKYRFLTQAARETLLAMASDWPFIIHNKTSEEYAIKRITGHIQNVNLVYDNMCKNAVNTEWLVKAEKRNNIFPFIDYNMFHPSHLEEPSPIYTYNYGEDKAK